MAVPNNEGNNDLPNYYEVLQISENAEVEVIEVAFKRLAFKYHPDRNREPGASRKMQMLNAAYETLSNQDLRQAYDAAMKYSHNHSSQQNNHASHIRTSTNRQPNHKSSTAINLQIIVDWIKTIFLPVKIPIMPVYYGFFIGSLSVMLNSKLFNGSLLAWFVPPIATTLGAVYAWIEARNKLDGSIKWNTLHTKEIKAVIVRWFYFLLLLFIILAYQTWFIVSVMEENDNFQRIDQYLKNAQDYAGNKQYKKAIQEYTDGIRLLESKNSPYSGKNNKQVLSVYYYERGRSHFMMDELEKAVDDYTQAITYDEKMANAYNCRGHAYLLKKEFEKAKADNDKAISLDPKIKTLLPNN